MRAELSILRARSIFVNQGWEIVRLNSTEGWQNVNCRRTYSIARRDWGGARNHSMWATSSLHQAGWLWKFRSMQPGRWPRHGVSTTLWAFANTHLHGLSKRSHNAVLEIRVPRTWWQSRTNRARDTDFPIPPSRVSEIRWEVQVNTSYMVWGVFVVCWFCFG